VSIRVVTGISAAKLRRQERSLKTTFAQLLANWQPNGKRTEEVPFIVARVLLQDFTGVPLLVDLAAMRSAVARLNKNTGRYRAARARRSVIDHSVQVDFASTKDAFEKNMEMEFKRNNSRYQF
jgi:aconitate hydratase